MNYVILEQDYWTYWRFNEGKIIEKNAFSVMIYIAQHKK